MAGQAHQAPGAPSDALRERYAEAFRAWLEHRDERELGTAYALGREAVSAQLSVLDLAEMHHDAAAAAIAAEPDPPRAAALIAAASTFLGEALSTFEIAHRGYHEVQELARLEHEHVEQLRTLAAASVRINASLTTEEALQLSADAAQQVLGVRRARISSTTGDPFARALSATSPPGGSPAETGAPTGVMLRSAGRPLGMLEVADDPAREFTPRDEAILAQLGQVASVAIAKTEAYTRERHIAQVLQRSLLPAALPNIPGMAAAVRFIAAGEGIEVGGDFYDLFGIADGGVAALIGDVCGKGPEAASVTALARHTLRAAAVYERRPSACSRSCTVRCGRPATDGRFCTVAYGELRPVADGGALMRLACGGHPLPLVLRAGGAVEPVGKLGTLLGADVEPVLSDVEVELRGGDLLVLYTDGVTEVRGAAGRSSSATTISPICSASAAASRPTRSRSACRTRC